MKSLSLKQEEEEMKRSRGWQFAKKQLKKQGWKKGKGLGRHENGISEALKVNIKCDKAGVGHNSAEQFTNHWWDHLFNSSAANIVVESGQEGVQVKKLRDGPMANKKPSHAPRGKTLYNHFVKAATLVSGREEALHTAPCLGREEEEPELPTVRRLTDKELLQACGGRTGHKGARHGFTMSAKLARLEEQEAAFLAGGAQPKPEEVPAWEHHGSCPAAGAGRGSWTGGETEPKRKRRRRGVKEKAAAGKRGELLPGMEARDGRTAGN